MTIGYMFQDLFACMIFLHENTSIMWQTYFHHVVGIVGFSSVIVGGGFVLTIGSASLLMELSNTFLNLNYYLKYHGKSNDIIFKVNGLLFMIAFLVIRVFYFGYCVYLGIGIAIKEDYSQRSVMEIVAIGVSIVMFLFIYILNLMWFKEIVNEVKKAVVGEA